MFIKQKFLNKKIIHVKKLTEKSKKELNCY